VPTLKEYFERDQGNTLMLERTIPLSGVDISVRGRLHVDFEPGATYISFYIPKHNAGNSVANALINYVEEFLSSFNNLDVRMGYRETNYHHSKSETNFTSRVYLYSENEFSPEDIETVTGYAQGLGLNVKWRSQEYVMARISAEIPLAFISHDHRDKANLARPLAIALEKLMCPVWYDEYSLKVGDSLRDSIETGLKSCRKCVFVLTPNFLANGGWAKREYDSIFTRELVLGQSVILPVWCGVSKSEIYEYSPILPDRVAAVWPDDQDPKIAADRVAAQLRPSILADKSH
jgi:hypothetical protein